MSATMKNRSNAAQSPACIGFQELLPLVAYGTFEREAERDAVTRHVTGCSWCQEEIALLRRARDLVRKSFDELPRPARTIQLSDIIALCEPDGARVPVKRMTPRTETSGTPLTSVTALRRQPHQVSRVPFVGAVIAARGVASGCSLLRPDDPSSRHDPERSEVVASLLYDAYDSLQRAMIEQHPLIELLPRLEECLRDPMAERQRMRVWYALALCTLTLGDQVRAQSFLDLAVDLAVYLEDVGACIECAFWLGVISCDLGQEQAAEEYFDIVLEALGIVMTEPDTAASFTSYYRLMIDALQAIPQQHSGAARFALSDVRSTPSPRQHSDFRLLQYELRDRHSPPDSE